MTEIKLVNEYMQINLTRPNEVTNAHLPSLINAIVHSMFGSRPKKLSY